MSEAELVQVYDLKNDREYVERVQAATVQSDDFALRADQGLFGSPQWWAAVRDGRLSARRIDGIIVQVYQRDAWPTFLVEAAGKRTSWAMDGDVTRYEVGKRVRVEYVELEYQKPQSDGERSTPAVLGIWVEP